MRTRISSVNSKLFPAYLWMTPIVFSKYQALGNDYIILRPEAMDIPLCAEFIRTMCHRNYGIGSDGILYGPMPSGIADFRLKIYNPDASIAEKSGNGLRIFARFCCDKKLRRTDVPFTIETDGGVAAATVYSDSEMVRMDMGWIRFDREDSCFETIQVNHHSVELCALSIGNPHCVILSADISREYTEWMGPLIEHHPRFPHRTNVQFMQILDRHTIQISIWERGAGYTLASGSSASAAAAVAVRAGHCTSPLTVQVPGGELTVDIAENGLITLYGPVRKVCDGTYYDSHEK